MTDSATCKVVLCPAGASEAIASIYQYAADAVTGRAIVCAKVRMACERFFRDLIASEREDYPWRFDAALAERPIKLMENYMIPPKGDYDKMELMPWQRFVEGNLYGWVSKATGLRRFTEGLIVVGRGNGKSTLVSGNAIYGAAKDGERGADIFLLANTKEQAGIVFGITGDAINASKLAKHFKVLHNEIRYPIGNASIQHRASDSRKLDGLNPAMAIFDEIHEYHNYKLINVIKRGMNKRRQPLALYITTMGSVLDGPLMDYYGLFTAAMTGSAMRQDVADRMFAFICELDSDDDVEDSSTWIKANPSLGVLLDLHQLEMDWERCKNVPQEKSDFICKQLNIFTNSGDAKFVDFEVLERNNGVIPESQLLGRDCFGGFDLALTEDFTSAALEFPLEDGRIYWMCHSWIPRKKAELDNEKIPYYEWQMQGWLSIVDDDYVHYEDVLRWFDEQNAKYHIMTVGYDIANAMMLVRTMEGKGYICNAVRQGSLTLNAPMKDLRERLLDGKVIFNNSPMCRWYLDNVKIHQPSKADADKENWMPSKMSRYQKIDGFAALLDAHTELMKLHGFGLMNIEPEVRVITIDGLTGAAAPDQTDDIVGSVPSIFGGFNDDREDDDLWAY